MPGRIPLYTRGGDAEKTPRDPLLIMVLLAQSDRKGGVGGDMALPGALEKGA